MVASEPFCRPFEMFFELIERGNELVSRRYRQLGKAWAAAQVSGTGVIECRERAAELRGYPKMDYDR